MMRHLWIISVIVAGCTAPGPQVRQLSADSVIAVMHKDISPYFHYSEYGKANQYLDSLRPFISAWSDSAITAAWHAYKGAAFTYDWKDDSARYHLTAAIQLADELGLPGPMAFARIQQVTFYMNHQQYDSALVYALEALELAGKKRISETPILFMQLSSLYRMAGDSAQYRKYLFEGLRTATDSMHIAALQGAISRYFQEMQLPDSADYFSRYFQSYQPAQHHYLKAKQQENAAAILIQRHEFNAAIAFLHEAIRLYKLSQATTAFPYFELGNCYKETGHPETAYLYLDTALQISRQVRDLEGVSNTLFQLSTMRYAQQQFEEAYQLLDSSYIYHLSRDSNAFQHQAAEIETHFASRMKDDSLSSLTVLARAHQKISRQRLSIIIALILCVPFIALSAILVARRRKLQERLKEAELQQRLLRSQMEPHFIFNALSVLQSHIRSGNLSRSIDFLNKFSRLLRISLENARHNLVPLHQEITALENYLALHAAQQDNCFDYFIENDTHASPDEIMVPPMLMQPFVENAIMHGFANRSERGWITIKIIRFDGMLRCVIEDNGWGLNTASVVKNKRSMSTTITKERLQLLSRQLSRKASLEIIDKSKSEDSPGIRVILDIPFRLNAS